MKDIPLKRIFRYFLAVMICLFFVANVLSNEARAEVQYSESFFFSGTNILDSTPTAGAATPVGATECAIETVMVDFDDGKRISNIYTQGGVLRNAGGGSFTPTIITAGMNSNYTQFTAIVSGTSYGSGVIGWDRVGATNNVKYNIIFDNVNTAYADTLTGKIEVELTYDKTIYSNNIQCRTSADVGASISAYDTVALEMGLRTVIPSFYPAVYLGAPTNITFSYTDTAIVTANNISTSFAYINLSKSGVNYGFNISNSTGGEFYGITSINDVSQLLNITDGIDFNLHHIGLDSWANRTIYDSSGQIPATPESAPAPSDNVLNGIGLIWNSSTYTLGSTGNVTWAKTTPALSCDNIKIYNKFNTLVSTIPNPEDSGFFKILLNDTGTWKAEYTRKSLCVGTEQVLNTAYTTVTEQVTSYLIINETTIAGQSENVTYRSGVVSTFAPYLAVINSEGIPEGQFSISGYSANTEGTSAVVIVSSGQHVIKICDAFGCDPVVAVTNTVFNTSIPTLNITQSNITLDSSTYQFEDTGIVTYAIDSTNFSNKAFLITSYNWDYAIEQTRQVGLSQTGSFEELFSQFLGRYIYTGNYSMRLVGRNDSGDTIVAFTNFTISDIDSEGYKLKMSKGELCIGEKNTFVVMSPTTSYLNITLNTNGAIFNSYYINMNKTITYKPAYAGTYSVLLISPEGYTKRAYTFDAKSCAIINASNDFQNGDAMEQKTDDFLSTGMFIVMIILLIFAGAGLEFGGIGGSIIGFGAGFIFLAIYGLVPLWSLFLFAILVITAFAVFLGEKITGQGGN